MKAEPGEVMDPDELGGATLHTTMSGVSDHRTRTEEEAYALLHQVCAATNQRRLDDRAGWTDWIEPRPPLYDPSDIHGIVNADTRIPFDVREVIARLVDGSELAEFKPEWGDTIVCGSARIWGHRAGIIANNGILFSAAALKATHFMELCEQRRVPLLFLQNTSGYMVGRDAEIAGTRRADRGGRPARHGHLHARRLQDRRRQ